MPYFNSVTSIYIHCSNLHVITAPIIILFAMNNETEITHKKTSVTCVIWGILQISILFKEIFRHKISISVQSKYQEIRWQNFDQLKYDYWHTLTTAFLLSYIGTLVFQEKEMKLTTTSIIKSHMHMNHGLDKSCDKYKLYTSLNELRVLLIFTPLVSRNLQMHDENI